MVRYLKHTMQESAIHIHIKLINTTSPIFSHIYLFFFFFLVTFKFYTLRKIQLHKSIIDHTHVVINRSSDLFIFIFISFHLKTQSLYLFPNFSLFSPLPSTWACFNPLGYTHTHTRAHEHAHAHRCTRMSPQSLLHYAC